MATMLNGTVSAAKNVIDAAREGAEHAFGSARGGAEHAFGSAREGAEYAFDSARHGTEHAVTGTRTALLDAVRTVGGLIATLRGLDRDDALGWVGLSRRRGPLPSIALFGAGMIMGAGIGVLFAPMSGAQMRSTILKRLKGVKEEVEGSIDQVASDVKEVEGKVEKKVEDLAGRAGDAVKKAELKIEAKVNAGAEAVKDAVVNKVDNAALAVKQAADDAKSSTAAAKPQHGGAPRH